MCLTVQAYRSIFVLADTRRWRVVVDVDLLSASHALSLEFTFIDAVLTGATLLVRRRLGDRTRATRLRLVCLHVRDFRTGVANGPFNIDNVVAIWARQAWCRGHIRRSRVGHECAFWTLNCKTFPDLLLDASVTNHFNLNSLPGNAHA